MDTGWIAALIGAGSGLALLALFARMGNHALAEGGYIALVAMLSIYAGAELVTGSLSSIITELVIVSIVAVIARLAMLRWPPSIGLFVFLHGCYDALFGAGTGVATWYPPLCAGFDFVVGIGLMAILIKRS